MGWEPNDNWRYFIYAVENYIDVFFSYIERRYSGVREYPIPIPRIPVIIMSTMANGSEREDGI